MINVYVHTNTNNCVLITIILSVIPHFIKTMEENNYES